MAYLSKETEYYEEKKGSPCWHRKTSAYFSSNKEELLGREGKILGELVTKSSKGKAEDLGRVFS